MVLGVPILKHFRVYGTTGTQERVLVRQATRAIRVRAIEVPLYYLRKVYVLKA